MCVYFSLLKRKYSLFFLIFFLFISGKFNAQLPSSFTTVPAASAGVITICEGESILFIPTGTNPTGTTYNWNFGTGSTPATSTSAGNQTVTYATASSTSASLNVNNGASISTVNIVINPTPSSTLTLLNTGSYSSSTTGGVTLFRNCSTSASSVFNMSVTTAAGTTSQTFNWGDGSADDNETAIIGGKISHNYPLGAYTLTHTVINSNGCKRIKTYQIFNGEAPIITVSGSGQTTCLPFPYSIDVLSNKIPGTNYTVSFTDGTPASTFSTINDTTIAHVFNSSSCGQKYPVGPITVDNAFQATIIAQNSCGATFATVGPITISTGAKAAFNYSPASPICEGETVEFKDQAFGGENVSQTGCSNDYSFYWRMEETTGFALTQGSAGSSNGNVGAQFNYSDWSNGTDSISYEFTTPGTYHMWQYAANACGVDSIRKEFVINPNATVILNPVNQTICSGDFTDTLFMESTYPGYLITWEVVDTFQVSGLNVASGSGVTKDTLLPVKLLNSSNEMGYYVIHASVGCSSVPPAVDTIFVMPSGEIQVTPTKESLCSGDETNIAITSNLSNATFTWTADFPPSITGASNGSGNEIKQTLTNLGNSIDTVYYTIYIGNVDCPGDSVIVPVAVQPGIVINKNLDIAVCPAAEINPDDYTSTPAGATYSWVNDINVGIPSSGTGQLPTWNAPSNATGEDIVSTFIVTAVINPNCPEVKDTFTVTIHPIGDIQISPLDTLICDGEPLDIQLESSVATATFSWSINSPTTISGATASTSANNPTVVSSTYHNTGTTIDTVFYTFTILNTACPVADVEVSVAVQPQILINTNQDISVCPGVSINPDDYTSTPAGATFTWTNSDTDIGIASSGNGQVPTWVAPENNTGSNLSGTIKIKSELNGCQGPEDEFIVEVTPSPTFDYTLNPNDGLSCLSTTADINGIVSPANATISWTGPGIVSASNTSSITINLPGWYKIQLSDPTTTCSAIDSVLMEEPNKLKITSAVVQNNPCYGLTDGSITIQTDNVSGSLVYNWTPVSSSTNVLANLSAGTYNVTVTNEDFCSHDSSFVITEPAAIYLTMTDSVASECGENNGLLQVIASGGAGGFTYQWDNGASGQINSNIDGGNYQLTVTDNSGCNVSEVFDLACKPLVPIQPNGFLSPNSDGKNDTWILDNLEFYPNCKVSVYNRWGTLVYQSQPYSNNWNGYYTEGSAVSGPLPAATYFYVIDTMKKSQDPIKGYLEIQY